MFYRFVALLVLLLAVTGLVYWMEGARGRQWHNLPEMLLLIVFYVGLFQVLFLPAEVFHDDVREQTLSSLWMLPCSRAKIFYGKLLGASAALVPVCVTGAAILLCNLSIFDDLLSGLKDIFFRPEGWYLIQAFLFLLHWIAWLSLHVKWPILAVGVGLITFSMIQMILGTVFALLAFVSSGGEAWAVLFALSHLGGWIGLHPLIRWRLAVLAAR